MQYRKKFRSVLRRDVKHEKMQIYEIGGVTSTETSAFEQIRAKGQIQEFWVEKLNMQDAAVNAR